MGLSALAFKLCFAMLVQAAYGPSYKVVGVKSREVLLNAGNIHCITQQWVKGW